MNGDVLCSDYPGGARIRLALLAREECRRVLGWRAVRDLSFFPFRNWLSKGFTLEGGVVELSFEAALVADWRFALCIVSHRPLGSEGTRRAAPSAPVTTQLLHKSHLNDTYC